MYVLAYIWHTDVDNVNMIRILFECFLVSIASGTNLSFPIKIERDWIMDSLQTVPSVIKDKQQSKCHLKLFIQSWYNQWIYIN